MHGVNNQKATVVAISGLNRFIKNQYRSSTTLLAYHLKWGRSSGFRLTSGGAKLSLSWVFGITCNDST